MSRKIWLALAIVALIAASFAASVVAAKRASDPRTKYTTHAFDYLHSRQTDSGGFSTPENTAWAILGINAKNERQGSSAWRVKGKSPFIYLQGSDLVAGASNGVENAPVYFSRVITAYVASGNGNQVATAGSKSINLLTELKKFQDMSDGPNKGAFAAIPGTLNSAIHSTAWAILALHGVLDDPASDANFVAAVKWLAKQQNDLGSGTDDGGFSSAVKGQPGNVVDTSLAIQALTAAESSGWSPANAEGFLRARQNDGGGFSYISQGGSTQSDATSAAIQAIIARGGDPRTWSKGTRNPYTALDALLQTNGSYRQTDRLGLIATTSWALAAQDVVSQAFTKYPKTIPSALKPFRFRPEFNSISPKNGAKYKTHIVLIKATYTDHKGGTGINPSACRLYVDNENRSRAADIGKYGLHLQLKNVPNGDHTYEIQLRDRAGNAKVVERKFVVAVPTPIPTHTPTTRPTYYPTVYPTVYPTHTPTPKPYTTPTPTPTPYQTVTPYPYTSPSTGPSPMVTGSPIPSPSASASPTGAGGSGGGGSAAGFVGGTLLAMLPIGAVISYLLLHRREDVLGTASQGTVLAGGGSTWERFKHTLARSKDLTRPSPRK